MTVLWINGFTVAQRRDFCCSRIFSFVDLSEQASKRWIFDFDSFGCYCVFLFCLLFAGFHFLCLHLSTSSLHSDERKEGKERKWRNLSQGLDGGDNLDRIGIYHSYFPPSHARHQRCISIFSFYETHSAFTNVTKLRYHTTHTYIHSIHYESLTGDDDALQRR